LRGTLENMFAFQRHHADRALFLNGSTGEPELPPMHGHDR
jgi:hypothetical protein